MTARNGRPASAGGKALPGRAVGALSGVLAAAVAIGIAQLLAGLSVPQASPVLAVGQAAIDLTPLPVKDWATSTFGSNDKNALLTGVFVVLFGYAMGIGAVAVRRLRLGMAGLCVFAAIGLAAALSRPDASAAYALPTLGGAAVGAFVLYRLVVTAERAARTTAAAAEPLPPIVFGGQAAAGPDRATSGEPQGELRAPDRPAAGGWAPDRPAAGGWAPDRPDAGAWEQPDAGAWEGPDAGGLPGEVRAPDLPGANVPPLRQPPRQPPPRRAFLATAGVALVAATAGEFAGRQLTTRRDVTAARSALRFPRPAVSAPPLPAGVSLPVPGISPFITPNSQFYRVDTALFVPQVDPSNWQLRIHGMVDREMVITFDQLLRRPLIEHYLTLCCVSNPVSGPYIGNAKWLGASLASLLREARPQRGASQLLSTSVDGFTSGTPLSVVLDGRDALVAVAMNGTALPTEHGFPARLVVPGLYGYVSACKWVVDIEVTTFESAVAYWAQRGWSQQGPVKTESRIDVPASGSQVKAGRVAVAGVAWAQHKGIEAVEVRVDGGPWHEATLAAVPGIDTWRQWVWQWDASVAGPHMIEARATDKTGYTQTAIQVPVAPNGATGYPSSQITVYA
jgi:DMSO/TMAO reductase YedYZ molybdopterin-dependent catalytic subunit